MKLQVQSGCNLALGAVTPHLTFCQDCVQKAEYYLDNVMLQLIFRI